MLWLPTTKAQDRDVDVTRETQKTTDTDIEDTQDFNTVETDHF